MAYSNWERLFSVTENAEKTKRMSVLKPWQRIDPDKELAAMAWYRAIGFMSDKDYLEIVAECEKRKKQKEHFERKQKVRSLRNWRRIIARALRGRK